MDAQGHLWLSWGSFWGGIFMQELDPRTGRLLDPKRKPVIIATRPGVEANPIEGATLVHRKANDAYYAFIAWDYCCPAPGKRVFDDHPYRIVVSADRNHAQERFVSLLSVDLENLCLLRKCLLV